MVGIISSDQSKTLDRKRIELSISNFSLSAGFLPVTQTNFKIDQSDNPDFADLTADNHWNLNLVQNGINGRTEDYILQCTATIPAHDNKVTLILCGR
jgi:hypothetical protein